MYLHDRVLIIRAWLCLIVEGVFVRYTLSCKSYCIEITVCAGVLTACTRDEIDTCTGGPPSGPPPTDQAQFDTKCQLVCIYLAMQVLPVCTNRI